MSQLSRPYQLLLITLITLLVFYPVLFAPACIVDDTHLQFVAVDGLIWQNTYATFFSNGGFYRPLLGLTLILDNYLWMLYESFMHLENMLLHLGNVILVFCVTERLVADRDETVRQAMPPAAALLFAFYPLTTESVDWISGRTDLLAALFILMSLSLLLQWRTEGRTSLLIFSQLAFFLACLSKETAVFYYPVGLLIFYAMSRRETDGNLFVYFKRYRFPCLATTITVIAYFALRKFAAYSPGSVDRGMNKLTAYVTKTKADFGWWDKIFEVFKTIGFYAKKLFIPWPLNFTIVKISDWYILLGLVVLVLLFWFWWRRRDLIAALLVSTFLVASSAILVSVGHLAWTPYAERYLYVPLVFFCPAAVLWLWEKLSRYGQERHFRAIMLAVCGGFLITTVQRNLVWMDGFALYEDCYRQSPNFDRAIRNYASALSFEGRNAEAKALFDRLPKKPRAKAKGTSSVKN